MKAIITATGIVLFGILLVEISRGNAQRPGGPGQRRNCSDRERPPINTTVVTCQRIRNPLEIIKVIVCAVRCGNCYDRNELHTPPACLVERKCQCLTKSTSGGNSTTTTTTTTTPSGETSSSTTSPTAGSTSSPGSNTNQSTQGSTTTTENPTS